MMRNYSKYLVGPADQFDPVRYTAITEEICIINEKVDPLPVHFKSEIIISFLKDHSLQKGWIDANPELTELVISNTLFTGSIESLFDSCRSNAVFRKGLEDYLNEKLTGEVHSTTLESICYNIIIAAA